MIILKILGLISALTARFISGKRPFGAKSTPDRIERILSDGFYAVFHQHWLKYFSSEQIRVLDGSQMCRFTI